MLYEQQPGRCFAENKLFVGKDAHHTAYSVSDVYRTGSAGSVRNGTTS